ncbi:glycosyltransferase [Acidiphilium sp.]|uniref:glycosyltransferase n=1 Tax=Acidiphilium sp. TaxID=527 RepID=UPI003D08A67C
MPSSTRKSLQFIYFDAGGGHRSAALALRQIIAERHPSWQVDLVNLQERLKTVDPVSRMTKRRVSSEGVYNGMLKRGWTYGSLPLLRGLQAGIKLRAPQIEAVLERHWRAHLPDLAVSLIPNFNGVLFRSLRAVSAATPFVTIMTDIADCPPHFWQEPQDQFIICGSDKAVEQAHTMRYRAECILRVSGMVLKPAFYAARPTDRRIGRERLGLDPDRPTALIMFGGNGSKRALTIVDALARLPFQLQTIVLCGNNALLQRQLASRASCCAVGFTDQVPDYMRLADIFIGKPGPGSISEALHLGLPVIVERNRRTMPQERFNTVWISENRLGLVVNDFRQIGDAVRMLFTDDTLAAFQANARRLNNRALFEIPVLLAQIMRQTQAASPNDA